MHGSRFIWRAFISGHRNSCARLSTSSSRVNMSESKFSHLPLSTRGPIECAVNGTMLLNTPYFNRGSAHTAEEREEFNLTGLLPQSVQTLEQQVKRAYEQYSTRSDDLAKNTFLTSLKDQNTVLYFKVGVSQSRPLRSRIGCHLLSRVDGNFQYTH
jgi:hypothetical protein